MICTRATQQRAAAPVNRLQSGSGCAGSSLSLPPAPLPRSSGGGGHWGDPQTYLGQLGDSESWVFAGASYPERPTTEPPGRRPVRACVNSPPKTTRTRRIRAFFKIKAFSIERYLFFLCSLISQGPAHRSLSGPRGLWAAVLQDSDPISAEGESQGVSSGLS